MSSEPGFLPGRLIIAWIELVVAAPCLLLGGWLVVDSLRRPELDVHGFGLLGGIFFLGCGSVLLLGAIGLMKLRRRHWLLHIPLLLWIGLLVAIQFGWVY